MSRSGGERTIAASSAKVCIATACRLADAARDRWGALTRQALHGRSADDHGRGAPPDTAPRDAGHADGGHGAADDGLGGKADPQPTRGDKAGACLGTLPWP
jgi:hypothetical protein